jgi:hypothetical protein
MHPASRPSIRRRLAWVVGGRADLRCESPLSTGRRPSLPRLLLLGVIAGGPAILGGLVTG